MLSIIIDENEVVCDTNTEYNSVIILGDATLVFDIVKKEEILGQIVAKYTPQFKGKKLPDHI